jgi:polyhydroxyalkanoate synthase
VNVAPFVRAAFGVTLDLVDAGRRRYGRVLDALGAGPQLTPSTILVDAPGFRLRRYGLPADDGPPVLIVPAPIKRWYIWDLEPDVSVVRRCLRHGLQVYLVDWLPPGRSRPGLGLNDYAERILSECADAIGDSPVRLFGHSLGGTLATIWAALHPDRVAALVLLEAPLSFGPRAGAFAGLAMAEPHELWLTADRPVPGSLLDLAATVAAPDTFHAARYADLALSASDPAALRTHLQVQRWTMDECPLPRRLVEDVLEHLYRRDELTAGTLAINGRRVGPADLTAPLLNVVNPKSRVIPPESITPFHHAAASRAKELLHYDGDVGVALQHVGLLVGRTAHDTTWPAVLRWTDHAAGL